MTNSLIRYDTLSRTFCYVPPMFHFQPHRGTHFHLKYILDFTDYVERPALLSPLQIGVLQKYATVVAKSCYGAGVLA